MVRKRIRELAGELDTLGDGGFKFVVDPPSGVAVQVADTVIRDFVLEDVYSTAEVNTAIDQAIAAATGNQTANGLVTGGIVAWESDYIYRVSAAQYFIDGTLYTSAEQTVTLNAADGANDRIDVLALDNTGAFVKITGTAAAQPSEPDIDPGTQLKLTFVLVVAATTEPATAADEDIYVDNTEWTTSTSGSGFNANSTNNPNSGTKCIEGTTVAANAYVQLQDGGSHVSDDYETLVFFIRSKANWNNSRGLRFQFYASGVAKGAAVNVARNTWGFDASQTVTYQFIAIPLSQFALPVGTSFNQLRITDYGGSIGFYIDDIKLKTTGSSGTPSGTSGISQEQADARYLQLTGGTLTGDLVVPDEAYDATAWNGSLEVPTKNAVRDKIEAVVAGGGYTNEEAQDAVGGIVDATLVYDDATPVLKRAPITGHVTIADGSNAAALGSFTKAQLNTAISDANFADTTQTTECIAGFIASPSDKSYKLVVKAPHGGTITETTTISVSGTCTATFKINTTALGGTANSVSSSEQSQAQASSNVFSAGDDIVLTVSSNSTCVDMSFSIKYTRTLE